MKTLIIAEKPSFAQILAKHLKATGRENGYYYNDTYTITYAFGHLVNLESPKYYATNPWDIHAAEFPIVPKPFVLCPTKDARGKKQLQTIKKLIDKADRIINATDAAREGELIFRYILEYCGANHKNVERLWVSSNTEVGLNKAFENLKPQSEYDGYYFSAKARNQSDWLFGMNGTIALTKTLFAPSVLSMGRVQTPTFAMVCKRYIDNKQFKPTPFYNLVLELEKDTTIFEAQYLEKSDTEAPLLAIQNQLSNTIRCAKVECTSKEVKPPKLFHLTELQKKASTKYKYTATQTLGFAQSLYEKHQMLTYPRTDSKYLTTDMKAEMPALFEKLKSYDKGSTKFNQHISEIDLSALRDEPFNDAKVSDHFALIPTGIIAEGLSEGEKRIFEMVLTQFIAAFSENAIEESTLYTFTEKQHSFLSKGKVFPKLGWKALFGSDKYTSAQSLLPKVHENDMLPIVNSTLKKGMTTAPKLLTEATLLGMMENCGREFGEVEDKEIKTKGIGTQATRNSIIDRIIEVGYIQREGKQKYLVPTKLGLDLYQKIQHFSMANVQLTGKWENALHLIANGKVDYDNYMLHIEKTLRDTILKEIQSLKGQTMQNKLACPKCKQTQVILKGNKYECTTEACDFSIWKSFFGKTITEAIYKELLELKPIAFKNLVSTAADQKKKFNATAVLVPEENKINLVFNANKTELICPKCQQGKLIAYDKYYGCENFKKGCKTSYPRELCKKKITPQILEVLFRDHKTPVLSGFTSKKRKSFATQLVLNANKELTFPQKS